MQAAIEALSHPGRRAILRLVLDRELPVGELAERVGVSQPAASQHLRVLRDARLVQGRVDGRRRLYQVDFEGLQRLRAELDDLGAGAAGAQAGRRGRRPDVRFASYEVTIAAPVEVVWAHLTTAEGLVRWIGPEATADPAPGGVLRWTHPNGASVVGRFVEVVPYRRLVFTYGWEDGRMGVPPESTTVEIDLVERDGATTVRLVHRGLPPEAVRDHQRGWGYFLGELRVALSAG